MTWRDKRVLVTGASGYIGRHLCQDLTDRGCEVTGLLRTPQAGPWRNAITSDLGRGNIDPRALEGVEVIFHLAGKAHVRARTVEEIREYETIHVDGTRALLSAAVEAKVRHFVLMSSLSVMGESGGEEWDESHACLPRTPYGTSKLEAERLVLKEYALPCPVVLRPALVYGPGSKGNLATLVRAVRSKLLPHISFLIMHGPWCMWMMSCRHASWRQALRLPAATRILLRMGRPIPPIRFWSGYMRPWTSSRSSGYPMV